MARAHGRILTSIWDDEDFLTLPQRQQRLYLFLISQKNLNHAGLLPLTLKRWSRKASDLSTDALEELLQELADARFVVVDEDTEEVLIRTFVRNDGVYKMPKVMGAMVSGAQEITSAKLRRALLAEMDRLPLDELSDEPTKTARGEGPSVRQQIRTHLETLRVAIAVPEPTPPTPPSGRVSEPPAEPFANPSGGVSEGAPEPSTRAHAGAHVRAAPALSPTPAPTTSPLGGGVLDVTHQGGAEPQSSDSPGDAAADDEPGPRRPDGLHPLPDDFAITDGERRWLLATFGEGIDADYETAQFISHFRGEGSRRKNWHDEWQKWIRRSAKWASERAARPPLRAVSGGWTPYQNPTDPNAYDGDL